MKLTEDYKNRWLRCCKTNLKNRAVKMSSKKGHLQKYKLIERTKYKLIERTKLFIKGLSSKVERVGCSE